MRIVKHFLKDSSLNKKDRCITVFLSDYGAGVVCAGIGGVGMGTAWAPVSIGVGLVATIKIITSARNKSLASFLNFVIVLSFEFYILTYFCILQDFKNNKTPNNVGALVFLAPGQGKKPHPGMIFCDSRSQSSTGCERCSCPCGHFQDNKFYFFVNNKTPNNVGALEYLVPGIWTLNQTPGVDKEATLDIYILTGFLKNKSRDKARLLMFSAAGLEEISPAGAMILRKR